MGGTVTNIDGWQGSQYCNDAMCKGERAESLQKTFRFQLSTPVSVNTMNHNTALSG